MPRRRATPASPFVVVSLVLLPTTLGQTCQQLLDTQFSGVGDTLPSAKIGNDQIDLLEAIKRVQGMVFLTQVPNDDSGKSLNELPNGKPQWFPFCSAQTMGPNQADFNFDTAYWTGKQPSGFICNGGNNDGSDFAPCLGKCPGGANGDGVEPLDSYGQCCDSPLNAGPCLTSALSGLGDKQSGSKCTKRWEFTSIQTFRTVCSAALNGQQYGIPYLMSGFVHDKAGPTRTSYFYHFEDLNFICMPASCTKAEVRQHLEKRAEACKDEYQSGCVYWLREITEEPGVAFPPKPHFQSDAASKRWAAASFGYKREDACTEVKEGNAGGAGTLKPPEGKFIINQFLDTFMGKSTADCSTPTPSPTQA